MDITDYERARDEIDNRTTLSSQLLNYNLIIVGVVISAFDKIPLEVMAVASCISSLFWLMWIDHTSQIYKLAAYLELVLADRVRSRHPGAFGWERFLRELDSGGDRARGVLHLESRESPVRVLNTASISRYVSFLFGGSSAALLLIFASKFHTSLSEFATSLARSNVPTADSTQRALIAVAAATLLLYGLYAQRQLRTLIGLVRTAVLARADLEVSR